ncbi:recombinase family protein [Streptomyces sp. QH1-20]|uniref:recombinase family protein n=1 Tax=Streptomyces sp. QH1-20 TaxID=3240934 RepID=UPI0035196AF0
MAVREDDGYALCLDPEYGPVLLEMIRLFMAVKSYGVVADWLNAGGVPTTADIARIRAKASKENTRLEGERAKPRGARWMASSVRSILKSRSLLGEYVRADDTVVRQADGSPVMIGEPVLTELEWLQLQEVVSLVKKTQGLRRVSPVRGFLFCDGPGAAVAPHSILGRWRGSGRS